MQFLPLLVAIVLGISALAFVLYPLYRRPRLQGATAEPLAASLLSKQTQMEQTAQTTQAEQTARNALQEVELDFQLGNLAESDYRALRNRYMRRAYAAAKARSGNAVAADAPDEAAVGEKSGELGAVDAILDVHEGDEIDEAIEAALRKMKEETLQREASE